MNSNIDFFKGKVFQLPRPIKRFVSVFMDSVFIVLSYDIFDLSDFQNENV